MGSEVANTQTNLPAAFAKVFGTQTSFKDELSQGVQASFAVMSIRGGKFRIKYKGEETVLTTPDGDARASIPVVLIRANPNLSKIFYEKQYAEGDDNPPDCFSMDGEKPDPGSPKKQCDLCATCPQNAFGSRITEAGKRAKACSDNRRVAIVPGNDVANEMFGGPMLLRIPPASLAALSSYADKLEQVGRPYFTVVTTLRFDPEPAYPKLVFEPQGLVTDDADATKIMEFREDPEVLRILSDSADLQSEAAASEPVTEEPPAEPEKAPEPEPKAEKPAEPEKPADPFAALAAAPAPKQEAEKPKQEAGKSGNGAASSPASSDEDLDKLISGALEGIS